RYGSALMTGLTGLANEHGLGLRIDGLPGAFHASFRDTDALDAGSLMAASDIVRYVDLANRFADHGIWVVTIHVRSGSGGGW
ncbi:MAG: hypothetical protein ACRDTD_32700, partial [Pseudonocardiaceae bacterium]